MSNDEFVNNDPRKRVDHSNGRVQVGEKTGVIKVTGDIEKFPESRIPPGWVQRARGEWVPQWPDCRFRRLNIDLPHKDPIKITPICLYNAKTTGGRGEEVTHDFCCKCSLAEPCQEFIQLTPDQTDDFEKGKFENLPAKIKESITPIEKHKLNRHHASREDVLKHTQSGIDSNSTERPKDARLWWQPCVHRESFQTECCVKVYCRCDDCPLLDKQITKKNCNGCEFRDSGREPDIDQ